MRILVIGAGILGLLTAWNLRNDRNEVTLVDRSGPFSGASHRSFAWINANHKLPESYHRLNAAGIAAHVELQRTLAGHGTWFHQNGCLMVDSSPDRESVYKERFDESRGLEYPVESVDRDRLIELEPSIRWPADSGLFFPSEGHLDNEVLGTLLCALLADMEVLPIVREVMTIASDEENATVAFSEGETAACDRVVLAAGADSAAIARRSGFRLPVASLTSPSARTHSFLGITAPTAVKLDRVVVTDRINVRPRPDGGFFVQIPPIEDRTEEGESTQLLDEVQTIMEHELDRFFGRPIRVDKVFFSGRSFPEDGRSIVGYVDLHSRIYSLVTHSGMTLGALLSRFAANELAGSEEPMLTDFRPSRFNAEVVTSNPTGFIGRQ